MQIVPIFRNRADAGRALAELVGQTVRDPDPLVLALPRGGVPVGFEVARALRADLDVFLVRKLGLPGQEELAIGAIASGGVRVLNEALVEELRLSRGLIDDIAASEESELKRREELYRHGRPALAIHGRTVILVDDGLATGATMKAASAALQSQGPGGLLWLFPLPRKKFLTNSGEMSRKSYACMRRNSSRQSASGTKIFPRQPTMKCSNCWSGLMRRLGEIDDEMDAREQGWAERIFR